MKLWQYFLNGEKTKKFITRKNVDIKNISEVKNLNRLSAGGLILDPLVFGENGLTGGTNQSYRYINILKNYNFNKWNYKNIPEGLTQQRIENLLFLWGRCILFKFNNKYYATNFNVVENGYNYDYTPKLVKPVLTNGTKTPINFPQKLEVGKDCVFFFKWYRTIMNQPIFR